MRTKRVGLFGVLIAMIVSINAQSEDHDFFQSYQDAMSTLDGILFTKQLEESYVMQWWNTTDEFIVSLFNKSVKDETPYEYFERRNIERISNMNISLHKNHRLYLEYKTQRPPANADQSLTIMIYPLNAQGSIYIIIYTRSWWEAPNCEGRLLILGTFRIIEQNSASGRYEITATQEQTNFYRHVMLAEKFRYYTGEKIKPYRWHPRLPEGSPIINEGRTTRFETSYTLGLHMEPYHSWVRVYWTYGPKGKLKATHYIYEPFSIDDRNLIISEELKNGQPISIPE